MGHLNSESHCGWLGWISWVSAVVLDRGQIAVAFLYWCILLIRQRLSPPLVKAVHGLKSVWLPDHSLFFWKPIRKQTTSRYFRLVIWGKKKARFSLVRQMFLFFSQCKTPTLQSSTISLPKLSNICIKQTSNAGPRADRNEFGEEARC